MTHTATHSERPLPAPVPAAAAAHRTRRDRVIDLMLDHGIWVALAVLVLVMSIASPHFLTVNNLMNIGQAVAVLGVVAAGVTIALIGGQLDLSVGSVIALTSVIIAVLVSNEGVPLLLAIAAAFGASLVIGAVNGLVVVRFGINSIVTTLATLTVVFGISLILIQGQTLTIEVAGYQDFIFSRPLGIPVPVYIMAAIYVLAAIFLYRTKLGWHVYATGGSEQAATRAGVKTDRVVYFVFLVSAVLATLGGVLTAGQTAAGSATYGRGTELDVLTAVLIGGIGLKGGAGRIERTLAGVLFIGVLSNGLILLDVESYYQQVIRGGTLLLAVILDATRAKRRSR